MKAAFIVAGLKKPLNHHGAIQKIVRETVNGMESVELVEGLWGVKEKLSHIFWFAIRLLPQLFSPANVVVSVHIRNLLAGIIKAKLQRKPLVFWELDHTCWLPRWNNGTKASLRFFVKFADRVIVPSRIQKRRLIFYGVPPNKIVVVPNPVNTEIFSPSVENKKENLILFVGRIIPHKGVVYLLKAFLQANLGGYRLLCIGSKQAPKSKEVMRARRRAYWLKCKSFAGPNIQFQDGFSERELIKYLRRARVFVFPSLEEGFGLALLEAMACGLPCVVNNIEPLSEIVGNAGLKVNVHDTKTFADTIVALLENPELQRELSLKARLRAKKFFSHKVIIPKIRECLKAEWKKTAPPAWLEVSL